LIVSEYCTPALARHQHKAWFCEVPPWNYAWGNVIPPRYPDYNISLLDLHNVREFTLDFSHGTPCYWDSFSTCWFPHFPNLTRVNLKVTIVAFYPFDPESAWISPNILVALIRVGNRNFGTTAKLSRVTVVHLQNSVYQSRGYFVRALDNIKWNEQWFWEVEKGTNLQRLRF
jgi:hypothetical protein